MNAQGAAENRDKGYKNKPRTSMREPTFPHFPNIHATRVTEPPPRSPQYTQRDSREVASLAYFPTLKWKGILHSAPHPKMVWYISWYISSCSDPAWQSAYLFWALCILCVKFFVPRPTRRLTRRADNWSRSVGRPEGRGEARRWKLAIYRRHYQICTFNTNKSQR